MGNARTRETTLLIVQHPTLKLNSNVLHDTLPLFYFRSHHEPFFPFSLFLSLSPPILFFHPLNFFRRRWEPHEKKKKKRNAWNSFILVAVCPYHASLLRSISISFLFFFQPATDFHPPPPLPPPNNNNNSFLCNNNVPPYSVEARRNVPDVSVELELIWLGESSERVAQMRSRM